MRETYMVKFYSSLIMKKTCKASWQTAQSRGSIPTSKAAKAGGEREIINGDLLYLPGEIILTLGAKGMCLRKM